MTTTAPMLRFPNHDEHREHGKVWEMIRLRRE
jgi:hypothetical protein